MPVRNTRIGELAVPGEEGDDEGEDHGLEAHRRVDRELEPIPEGGDAAQQRADEEARAGRSGCAEMPIVRASSGLARVALIERPSEVYRRSSGQDHDARSRSTPTATRRSSGSAPSTGCTRPASGPSRFWLELPSSSRMMFSPAMAMPSDATKIASRAVSPARTASGPVDEPFDPRAEDGDDDDAGDHRRPRTAGRPGP